MKKICNTYYAHVSCADNIIDVAASCDRNMIQEIFDFYNVKKYTIIKYDKTKHKLSLIESPDWDTAKEPIVGDSFILDLNSGNISWLLNKKIMKANKNNPQIYHQKELFVADDYKGFDVEAARQRTKQWNSIPNLNKNKIGRKNYWVQLLAENGMEV